MRSNRKLIRRDGGFNIVSKGLESLRFSDLYHSFIRLDFKWFLAIMFAGFIGVNALFATLYWMCGPTALDGLDPRNGFSYWVDCFFFSIQTFATIGYGKILPIGLLPNILVTLESFVQILMIAIATGLLFARFSRPTSRMLFSRNAIIGPLDGDDCLFFRVANERFNQIVDATASVTLLKSFVTKEGKTYRDLIEIKLEREHMPIFALTWTVCHIIDDKSPLKGITKEALEDGTSEFVVSIIGTDETVGQTIHARHSYSAADIAWNHQFVDMVKRNDDNSVEIELDKIHLVHPN